jgi:hypothetical protein
MNKIKLLFEFIPIIVVFLLLSYTKPIIHFSTTILGKCISVFIIIFYTYIDVLYGLLACFLVIIYYNSSYVEGMEDSLNFGIDEYEKVKINTINDMELSNEIPSELYDDYDYEVANVNQIENASIIKMDIEKQDNFINENCHKGILKYKNQIVKSDMAQHVFPELNYLDEICNPCDNTCKFTILDKKIIMEEKLIPKNSNEFYKKWNILFQ